MSVRLDPLKTVREAAGLGVSWLARLSNTSDAIINTLEAISLSGSGKGGTVTSDVADRIIVALGSTREDGGFVELA